MNSILIGIMAYVAAQLVVGILVSRRVSSESDYLVAGRRLGYPLATFTVFATWFGAETCIGSAGSAYTNGLAGGTVDPFGYTACLVLMGLVFAAPLWRRKLTTLADLFRERYGIGVERLAVVLMVPTSVFWAAAQIRAFGHVLAASSSLEVGWATTIASAVVIVYTFSGGLLADAVTDFVQGVAIIIGLLVLFSLVLAATHGTAGGLGSIEPERLRLFDAATPLQTLERWAIPIGGSVLSQELVARTLASRSPSVARGATLLGAGLYLIVGLVPLMIGLVAAGQMPGLSDPEQALPLMAQRYLPGVWYVLFAGAVVSAILSTVDSALLAAASLTSHNLVVPLLGNPSDRTRLRLARGGVLVFGVVAYFLALYGGSVYELVEESSGFASAGVLVVVVFGLFTRFGHAAAAVAALLGGVTVWIAGRHLGSWPVPFLSSLGAALLAYVVVAWMGRHRHPGSVPTSSKKKTPH